MTVAAIAVVGIAMWRSATPGRRAPVPVAPVVAVLGFIAVLAVAALTESSRRTRLGAIGLAAASIAATVLIGPTRMVGLRIWWSDTEATAKSVLATHTGEACGSVERPVDSFFGDITDVCVFGDSVMLRTGDTLHGLLYDPSPLAPRVQSMCVNHVFGPWWEVSEFVDAGCPRGFDGRGGG